MSIEIKFTAGYWRVFRRYRLVASFKTRDDAQDFAQGLVDDLRWEASNRD